MTGHGALESVNRNLNREGGSQPYHGVMRTVIIDGTSPHGRMKHRFSE